MDPALGRFMTIDPMTDFFNNQSPYAVANNSPIANVDYYGLGLFNAIGNIFKRVGNGVANLFRGGRCNCKTYVQESLRTAWGRTDNILPSRIKRIKKPDEPALPSGLIRRPKGQETVSLVTTGGLVDLSGANIVTPDLPRIFIPKPPIKRKSKKGKEIEEDEDESKTALPIIGISYYDIPFKPNTTHMVGQAGALKILRDLIKTLKEYPQLKVIVDGQVGVSHWPTPPKNLNATAKVNGGEGPLKWLSGGRANAVIRLLKRNGVNADQLIKGNGAMGDKSNVIIRPAN